MVSGTMVLTRTTLMSGSGAIGTQRGNDTWGANYTFNKDGAQNDLLLVAEELSNLSTSGAFATDAELAAVSGAITYDGTFIAPVLNPSGSSVPTILSGYLTAPVLDTSAFVPRTSGDPSTTIGSQADPFPASGLIMKSADGGSVMALYILENGLVSGVAL